jgi:hypothetical protein
MKVWIVDSGAYENNYIDKIFLSQTAAEEYVLLRNKEAEEYEKENGYRPMDLCWDLTDYEVETEAPK